MEPFILWYEKHDKIILVLEFAPIKNTDIVFNTKSITISFDIGDNTQVHFYKELELFSYIDVVKSSFIEKSNKLEITLEKSINVSWKQLTKKKDNKIQIDWSNWTFIDDPPDNLFEIPNLSNTANALQSNEALINSMELSDSDHSD